MSITMNSSAERNALGQFLLGHSGRGGRPRGSRAKLGEAFLADLRATWEQYGPQALERCAKEEPAAFARLVATLMPDRVEVGSPGEFSDLTSVEQVIEAMLDSFDDLNGLVELLDQTRTAVLERLGKQAKLVDAVPAPGRPSSRRSSSRVRPQTAAVCAPAGRGAKSIAALPAPKSLDD